MTTERITMFRSIFILGSAAMFVTSLLAETNTVPIQGVPVTMTVTPNVEKDKRTPQIEKQDIFVKKGKERLEVAEWVPARGARAGLELFILIEDTTTNLGPHLADLRAFIKAQPSTTLVGVGYARNAVVEIRQNPTSDHKLAADSLRLPLGSAGAFGSPYLSVADLMKRWPETSNRREVIMLTDGIDRARRERNALFNPDVDFAADVAQRTGTIIHTIYFPGTGHWHRNFWEATNGQNAIAKLSDLTGGESFSLGREAPVSIAPYLDDLQRILDNQYLLTFYARPDKKAGLQYVNVTSEVAGADFSTPNSVWVPAAK